LLWLLKSSMSLIQVCETGSLEQLVTMMDVQYNTYFNGLMCYFTNQKDNDLTACLFAACKNKQHGVQIITYLSSMTNVHSIHYNTGNNLLHEACLHNNAQLVGYLINIIDPNITNKDGKTIVDIVTSNQPTNVKLVDFICLHPAVTII